MEKLTEEQIRSVAKKALDSETIPQHEVLALTNHIHAMQQQNKQMKEALEWYADENNHTEQRGSFDLPIPPEVMSDYGQRARDTLQSIQGGGTDNENSR